MLFSLHTLEITIYSLLNFLPYLLLAIYPFQESFRFSKKVTGVLIACITTVQIVFGLIAIVCPQRWAGFLSMLCTLTYFVFYFFAIKEMPGKLLFMLLIMSNVANMVVSLSKCLEGFLFPSLAQEGYRWSYCVTTIITQVIVLTIVFLFIRKYFKNLHEMQEQKQIWRYLWLIPASFYLFWFQNLYFKRESSREIALDPVNSIYIIFINAGAMFVYSLIAMMIQSFIENGELQRQNELLNIQTLQYQNMKKRMEDTRKARHDLHHHLAILRGFLENGCYREMEKYLNDYLKTTPSGEPISFCQHFSANVLIDYYWQYAKDNSIIFQTKLDIPQHIFVADTDLCVFLGNLLENACEACLKLPKEQRHIYLSSKMTNPGTFVITIDNTFPAGSIQIDHGHFLSSKHKGRGIGTESIINIVKKYNGVTNFKEDSGMFCVSIVMYD